MVVKVIDNKREKERHQTLYFGERKTIIRNPKNELKTGPWLAMLRHLGISTGFRFCRRIRRTAACRLHGPVGQKLANGWRRGSALRCEWPRPTALRIAISSATRSRLWELFPL